MSMCKKCEREITEEEEEQCDSFKCDECQCDYHNECAEVRKGDAKRRKSSKSLRILCPFCSEKNDESPYKKLDELMQLAYKTDVVVQEQKGTIDTNNNLLGTMAKSMRVLIEKVNELSLKVDVMQSNSSTSTNVKQNAASYAKTASSNPVKPVVVIKPKQKQQSNKTYEELTKAVDKKSVDVCGTRNTRDGGIVLQCRTSTETMRVKQLVSDKLGDNYEVTLPAIKKPRLRITNIDASIADDKIIDELKQQNESIRDFDMKLVTVIPRKYRSAVTNDAIVEVKSDVYHQLLDIGVLDLLWSECRILEHLHVKRCFKCLGFSHIASQCKRPTQSCSRCAGPHRFADCKSNKMCCANCKAANQTNNLGLDTRHHAYSKGCTVLQRRIAVIRSKIEYNPLK